MKERDRMQILLEDIRSKVELIAEGHGVLQSGINQLRNDFGELRNEFGELRGEFGQLRNEFGQLSNKVDRIENKVTQNQITLYAMNDKLDEHMRQPAHA